MSGNAAIYSLESPPLPGVLEKLGPLRDMRTSYSEGSGPTQYAFRLESVTFTINVMPSDQMRQHLEGFCNYVLNLHRSRPSDQTEALLAQIARVQTVLGIVVEPGFDEAEVAADFVWSVAEAMQGLVFAADSVFSPSGVPLVGPGASGA